MLWTRFCVFSAGELSRVIRLTGCGGCMHGLWLFWRHTFGMCFFSPTLMFLISVCDYLQSSWDSFFFEYFFEYFFSVRKCRRMLRRVYCRRCIERFRFYPPNRTKGRLKRVDTFYLFLLNLLLLCVIFVIFSWFVSTREIFFLEIFQAASDSVPNSPCIGGRASNSQRDILQSPGHSDRSHVSSEVCLILSSTSHVGGADWPVSGS